MQAVFRLDASRAIGLGHLSRSSNLALALADRGVSSTFVVGGEGGAALARARLPGDVEVRGVATSGSDEDLETTAACAADARVVVVDHYGLPSTFLTRLRARVACLCVLDDIGDRDLRMADLVVNSTPAAAMVDYPPELEPRLLRGDYVLLHPAFAAQHRRALRDAGGPPRRVLFAFGGTDAASLLPTALAETRRAFPGAEIHAVLGAADPSPPTHGEVRFHALPPEAMAERMAWAELALATPSTVAWELAAVGTPAILCRVFDNQTPTARYFRALDALPVLEGLSGLPEALEWFATLPLEDLTRRTRAFASTCDGSGAARLAARLAALG